MARWFKFTKDYDHYWPNRAVTAFKAGMVVHVKDEVADAAKAAKVGTETDKPDDAEPGYASTPSRLEGRIRRITGNPVASNRALSEPEPRPAIPAPGDQTGVEGKALSAASGGEQTERVANIREAEVTPRIEAAKAEAKADRRK